MSEPTSETPPEVAKIGIVENEAKYRDAARSILEQADLPCEIHSWPSAEQYWHDPAGESLDLLLLDIELPNMNGVELAGRIKQRRPDARIVMLTVLASDETIFRALQAGACGYVLKVEMERLPEIVRTVLGGGAYMTPTIALRVMQSFQEPEQQPDLPRLSERESQVLELLATGMNRKHVAGQLGISESTVCFHIKNIYEKLNVRNRVEMVQQANNLGLL